MKKNYFKKSVSLVLTVLMLMSCWVFVPGEHQIEAEAALAYGMSAVDGASKQDKVFKDQRTDSTGDYVQIKYPSVMYMDVTENLSDTGYSVHLSTSFGSGDKYQLVILPALWGGQQHKDEEGKGTFGTADLKGQTNIVDNFTDFGIQNGDLPGYFDNYAVDGNNIALTCGNPGSNIGTTGFNAPFIGQPKAAGTYTYNMTKANGTPTTAKYIKTGSGGYTGTSWANDTYDGGTTPTNYQIIVYDKSTLNSTINSAKGYLSQTSKYTSDSLSDLQTAINNATSVLTTREVLQNDVDNQVKAVNNAVNALVVARNYDITYENIFSLTDWSYTSSYNYTYETSAVVDIENGDTLRIYKKSESGELTTSSSYPNNHQDAYYSMAVTGGKQYTVRYTIAENSSVSGTAQSEVFMFWYDANNNPIQSTTSSNTFDHQGFSGMGVHSVTFTVPANATKAEIRFDNDCSSSGCTLRFKDIAVYPAERAAEVDLDNWTVRPTKKTFGYHVTLSGKLDIPERKGYKFNGWYIDNVNVNGKKDSGEEVTDAEGNVIMALTMDKAYNLYADWTGLPMDIGYDNIFSLAEWAYNPTKNNTANGTFDIDVEKGTIKITHDGSDTGTDLNTSQQTGDEWYKAPVKGDTEYVLTWNTSGAGRAQIHVFFATGNQWTYNTVDGYTSGANWFVSNGDLPYSTTMGSHEVVFKTLPETDGLVFRFGTCNSGDSITFSDIRLVEKSVYDAYAKDYSVIRVPFNFGDTTNLSLVPTRAGYKFDGWYTADGTKLTSVDGLKASDTVYAKWIQLYTVTFKNYDGTVLKTAEVAPGASVTAPVDPSMNPDDNYEYVFAGWDADFSNVQSDLVVNAKFNTQAHSDVRRTYKTGSTCTSAATYTKLCAACNYAWTGVFEDEDMPATGHSYEWDDPSSTVITGSSTGLGDDDLHTIACTECGEETQVKHNFIEDPNHPATEATCVVAGKIYYKCACLAEKTVDGATNPNNHKNTELRNEVAAKCGQPGYSGDKWCKDCDKEIEKGSETAALDHVFTTYTYNNDAKCGVDGTETAVCGREGCEAKDVRTKVGSALEHSFTNYVDQDDATCDKEGTEIAVCNRDGCNETDSRSTGKKREHRFDGTVKNNNDGTHSFECSYDDCDVYGGTVDCGYGEWTNDNATTHSHSCETCGYTPAAEAHDWSAWTTVGGSATSKASQTRNCEVCGRVEDTECNYKVTDYKAATCETAELTTYECEDCGHGYTATGEGPKGHKFEGEAVDNGNGTHSFKCTNDCGAIGYGEDKNASVACTDWEYVNTEAGKHTATCKVCSYVKTEDCSGGDATCTAPAVCEFCSVAYGTTADHEITGTEKYLKKATDATCIANETYYKYCIGCENVFSDTETYEKPDSMADHDYTCTDEYLYIATQAKCGVNETYYAYCSNPDCKKSSEDAANTFEKDGTALTHNWVNPVHNDGTLTHTLTCDNTNTDGWACTETMTANCEDSAITFGLEAATCTEQGYTTVQCVACNYTWNINIVPALGHDYTKQIVTEEYFKTAANCEATAVYYYACSRCERSAKDIAADEVYTGQVTYSYGEVRAHAFQEKIADQYFAKAATCFDEAEYYTSCKYADCGKSSEEVYGEGNGITFKAPESKLAHNWTATKKYPAEAATCIKAATYYYECSLCGSSSKDYDNGSTWTDEDSFSGHNMTYKAAEAATCNAAGNYEYWFCSVCNKYFKDANGETAYNNQAATVIKKRAHDLEYVDFKAPTCEEDGHPDYEICKYDDCNYTTYPDVLESGYKAKGHNFTGDLAFDPFTNYHYNNCRNIGCTKVGTVVDGAQVEYKVTYNEDDTITVVGGIACDFKTVAETVNGVHSHTLTCECGNKQSRVYSDEETFVKTVAPTCTADGYDSYACPDEKCTETWIKNVVKTEGHKAGTEVVANNNGTHSYKCSVCGEIAKTENCSGGTATCKKPVCTTCKAEYGEATGEHVYGDESTWEVISEATCKAPKQVRKVCANCNNEEVVSVGNKLNHQWSAYEYTKEATCSDYGMMSRTCALCGDVETKTGDKLDKSKHNYDENNYVESGNCATGMVKIYTCLDCGGKITAPSDSGHKFEANTKVYGSCDKNGYIIFRCSVCGLTKILDETVEGFGGTVEFEGIEGGVDTSDLKMKEHSWGEVVETKAPTCAKTGRGYQVCANCNTTQNVEIPTIAHELRKVSGYDATCTVPGLKEHNECKKCGYTENANNAMVIPATGHTDADADGSCDVCDKDLGTASSRCGCICHKESGFMQFIYKILRFFWKLFGKNKACSCGTVHY